MVSSVTFSPDGSKIVSGSYDMTVRVWDASTGMEAAFSPLQGLDNFVTSVAFSQDCSKIVSASINGTVCIWDANTGVQLAFYEGETSDTTDVLKDTIQCTRDTVLSVDPDNWITHHPSRRKAQLPQAVPLYDLQPHGAMLVGWHQIGHYPVIIRFP